MMSKHEYNPLLHIARANNASRKLVLPDPGINGCNRRRYLRDESRPTHAVNLGVFIWGGFAVIGLAIAKQFLNH